MKEYNFGVVIVTYNRLELLKECIDSVLKQERPFSNVTIVNNNSNDGTKEYLDAIDNNFFTVIHTDANLGGAGGFKIGVDSVYKKVDYVLLIDDDAMLSRNFLKQIEKSIVNNIYAYSGSVLTGGVIDRTHRRRIKNKVLLTHIDVQEKEYDAAYFDYDLSTFCGLVIKTSVINEIGLPKSEYFIWYDDTEYSLRINKISRIRNINSAVIDNKTKLSYSDRYTWKSYYGYRNKIDMGRIYSSCPVLFISYRVLFHMMRVLQYTCTSIFSKKDRRYYRFAAKLMEDAVVDSLIGRLGKNAKYLPE